jgi:DNA polymerase-3 subunit beta
MNIECGQDKILEGIHKAQRIAGKHPTLPVLSCVLLEAKKNNTLVIKATNLDLGVEIIIPAKVNKEGTVAVPAAVVYSFLSSLITGGKDIKLEVEGNNLLVRTQHSNGTIKTMPSEEFPNIPKITDGKEFTLSSADFIKGLKSVWYSASISGVKPELSSVYVYQDAGYIMFAATDSFRLAEKKIKLKKSVDFGQILIPFKNISEIVRIFEGINADISINFNKNQIALSYNGIYLISRVIDGVFPDYRQIIPKEIKTNVVVLKQDFSDAMKISNIFSDKFNQIHFKIAPSKSIFEIQTKNNDVGENLQKIDATVSGDETEINFNHRYIIDCLQSVETDSISLDFSGPNRPLVIRPVADNTFLYLVMPMNR